MSVNNIVKHLIKVSENDIASVVSAGIVGDFLLLLILDRIV